MEETIFIFFFCFFIYVCRIPNYTMFVYLLEFKKIISFFYKEDLVSRCIYIHIKVDNFVYMYITYFRIRKLKFIFSYTHIYYVDFFRVVSICDLSLSWHNSLAPNSKFMVPPLHIMLCLHKVLCTLIFVLFKYWNINQLFYFFCVSVNATSTPSPNVISRKTSITLVILT